MIKSIKGKLAKKIYDFEKAHPEIDTGWFADLIRDIVKGVEERTEKRVYKEIKGGGLIIAQKDK